MFSIFNLKVFHINFNCWFLLKIWPAEYLLKFPESSLCSVVANALDCDIVLSKIKLQSHYYIQFWTNTLGVKYEAPYPYSHMLNSITVVLWPKITHESWYVIKQRKQTKPSKLQWIGDRIRKDDIRLCEQNVG